MRLFRRRTRFVQGSGNLFADLGVPDAEELHEKSTIAIAVRRALRGAGIDPNTLYYALGGHLDSATLADFTALRERIDVWGNAVVPDAEMSA